MPPKKHKHCGSLTRGESRPRGGRTSVQKVLDLLAQLGGSFGAIGDTIAQFGSRRSRLEGIGVGDDDLLMVSQPKRRAMQIGTGLAGDPDHQRPLE